MTVRIGITGAAGRMGRTLIEAISLVEGLTLTAAIERPESTLLGADSGELAGLGKNGVAVVDSLATVIDEIDVLIDFSVPAATLANLALCREKNAAIVIGTTGFTPEQQGEIEQAAGVISICKASNFSTGVNLCFK
jgi:4-hydroxy-tetrahydrodipicolinate reductase